MKRAILFGAAVLSLALLMVEEASAQRRGGGGGVRMAGVEFRGAAIRGPVGVRGAGVGYRGGYPGIYRGVGYGVRTAGIRGGYAVRGAAWRPGWGAARPGWRWYAGRRVWGWGLPVAAGIGLGYYGYSNYYNDCLAWNGYGWLNVCNQPYPYSYW